MKTKSELQADVALREEAFFALQMGFLEENGWYYLRHAADIPSTDEELDRGLAVPADARAILQAWIDECGAQVVGGQYAVDECMRYRALRTLLSRLQ